MAEAILCGIYAIRNTHNGGVYVGSAERIVFRWRKHKADLRANRHHSRYLQRVWNKLGEDKFVFEVLEEVADANALITREQCWIDRLKAAQTILYNVCPTAGSSRGRFHSPEARLRLRQQRSTPEARAANSARQLGKVRSEESKTKHRATLATPECRARLRAAHLGRKATLEAIEANRRAQTGRVVSEATRAKMRANGLGKRHTKETKTKISRIKTGHKLGPFTAEHRENMRRASTGRRHNDATKEKMRIIALNRPPASAEHRANLSAALKGIVKSPEWLANIAAAKAAKRVSLQPVLHLPTPPEGQFQPALTTKSETLLIGFAPNAATERMSDTHPTLPLTGQQGSPMKRHANRSKSEKPAGPAQPAPIRQPYLPGIF